MFSLVLLTASAALAAPSVNSKLPFLPGVFRNRSSFFNASHSAEALSRFRSTVGEAVFSSASAESAHFKMTEEFGLAHEKIATRMNGMVFDAPSIAEINAPIAAYLHGSDIMRAPEVVDSARQKRGAPVVTSTRWLKSRPIAYIFNNDIDESVRKVIRTALTKMAANTCLSFQENGSGPQLQFHRGGGCWSYIGNTSPTKQLISIDSSCEYVGIVSHEVAHALGIDHTQNRKDRDNFVTVNMGAVSAGNQNNYQKLSDSSNDNFGVPYEYGSVMHYASYDLSASGQAVVLVKELDYVNTIGQRKYMTFNDYKLINSLYKCSEQCSTQIVCQNGGYPSPKDCNSCVCNDFYTGANCQTPKSTITLTSSSSTTFNTPYDATLYSSGNNYNWDMFTKDSVKIIRAPEGKKIRVTINQINAAFGQLDCYVGCPFVGLEFVDTANGDLTGMGKIFCCTKDQGYSFVSKSNVIGYKAYSSPGMPLDAKATYTIV